MVRGKPSTNGVQIIWLFKNMTARWRNQFFYVNIGETFFYLKQQGLVRRTTLLVWNHFL